MKREAIMKSLANPAFALAALIAVGELTTPTARAFGLTWIVDNLNDSGSGSLRGAIAQAGDGDNVRIDVTGSIFLTSGELLVTQSITIAGPGTIYMTVSGGGNGRVFNIASGDAVVTITGLTIADGVVRGADASTDSGGAGGEALGGGAYVGSGATLNLGNCFVARNQAVGGGGGSGRSTEVDGFAGGRGANAYGGAIYSEGLLRLTNCTFFGNAAVGGDGGVGGNGNFGDGGYGGWAGNAYGGAIHIYATCPLSASGTGCDARFVNCTISDNAAMGGRGAPGGSGTFHGGNGGTGGLALGGGILSSGSRFEILNCTITANTAQGGNAGGGGGATFTPGSPGEPGLNQGGGAFFSLSYILLNSIIAGNSILPGAFNLGVDVVGDFSSLGHNLIGKREGSQGWIGSDLAGTIAAPIDPKLGLLQFNGGLMQTHALLAGSPAIDAGDDAVLATPYSVATDERGRARRIGAHADIGAYESGAVGSLLVTTLLDSGPGSLRDTIALSIGGDTIGFAPNLSGTILLTSGEIPINHSLAINGPANGTLSSASLVVSGHSLSRVFNISSGNVAICGLTIANGAADAGAGVYNAGTLTVCNDEFSGNQARNPGGAIYNLGSLTVRNCAFSGNDAGHGGGIGNYAALTVLNSTFANNHASFAGGAIYHFGYAFTLGSSTVSANTGDVSAGGVYSDFDATAPEVRNCILAGNKGPFAVDAYGPFTSRGFNLIGKADPNFTQGFGGMGDQVGTLGTPIDPKLGALDYHGGATRTMALMPGSPAIDQGHSGANGETIDQRGGQRPVDNPGVADAAGGDGSDIGAYERDGLLSFNVPAFLSTNAMIMCFGTELGGSYRVEYTEDFLAGIWQPLGDALLGDGYTTCVADRVAVAPRRFYRVRLLR